MKRKNFPILAVVMIASMLTACDRNDDPIIPIEPAAGRMVKKLVVSPTDFMAFNYDNSKRLTGYSSQWQNSPDGGTSSVNFQYTYQNSRLIKATSQHARIDYKYEGNKLAGADNFLINGRKLSTHAFQYDNQGRITDLIESIEQPDEVAATKIHLSYRADGNVGRIDYMQRLVGSEVFVNSFSKVFEDYDAQPNPVPSALLEHFLPGQTLFKNNPKLIRNLDANATTSDILRITYQYDDNGYPTLRDQQIEINGVLKPVIRYNYEY